VVNMKVGKALNEYEVGKYICMITISVDQLLIFFIVVKCLKFDQILNVH
jgi:hypothetical protein